MSEKLLVTQALDERDLLVKKIHDKISRIRLIDCKKRNKDKTVNERLSAEEFGKQASASYQQITDLIERYQRIDAAIIASNASTRIETSFGSFTVAGAIALRNRLKTGVKNAGFEQQLIDVMQNQYNMHVQYAESKNKSLDTQAKTMRLSILGEDSKVKDERPLKIVDVYIRENTTEVIDPLDIQIKMQELRDKIDTLVKELDTQIKVSNATTMIEF